MKKVGLFLIMLSLSILLVTTVYAAGTSTGSSNDDRDRTSVTSASSVRINNATNITNATRPPRPDLDDRMRFRNSTFNRSNANCESVATQVDRIRCRLANRNITHLNVTEESCRNITNPANCQALYNRVAACYSKDGRQKDQCFKRIAGFAKARVADEAKANNKGAMRNYMVFLLYDLQERIEDKHQAGELTDDEAANLIDQIVNIKKALLENKPRAEIKPLLDQFKLDYREAMQ